MLNGAFPGYPCPPTVAAGPQVSSAAHMINGNYCLPDRQLRLCSERVQSIEAEQRSSEPFLPLIAICGETVNMLGAELGGALRAW